MPVHAYGVSSVLLPPGFTALAVAILASNTSVIPITQVMANVVNKARALGCVYREPKPAHNGDEARSGLGVKR